MSTIPAGRPERLQDHLDRLRAGEPVIPVEHAAARDPAEASLGRAASRAVAAMNDEMIELFRPECWLGDREYEIHISGAEPCDHGWLPTDPDSTCDCWDTKP
jgi:hypothetical protein